MLIASDIHAYYGQSHVLQGISLEVKAGEVVAILGRNGSGKTTTLLTIMGFLSPAPGRVSYEGRDISGWAPYRVSRLGLGFVPQERGVFPSLTVRENLTVAARKGRSGNWTLQQVFKLFPRLEERAANRGSQLSGGEQQMLSIARALLLNPSLLILDEPSEGLAPLIVQEIISILRQVRDAGLAILLVEQNMRAAFAVAERHYIRAKGRICYTGTTRELESNEAVLHEHLGIS
jgi:branched-chain amino acid transport system ATP-binding protein